MEKTKLYGELKEKIDSYLYTNPFEMDGDEYNESVCQEFELSNGILARCELEITGYNRHDRGDYFCPPSDSGEINCEVREVVFYDKEGEEMFKSTYVKELETSISY